MSPFSHSFQKRILLAFFVVLLSSTSKAQVEATDSVEQKDLIDLALAFLRRERSRTVEEIKASGIKWAIVPGFGYTLPNGFIVAVSTNGAFFTSSQIQQNQSIVYTSLAVTSKSQFTFTHQHNIWGRSNKYIFTGDHRYWIYPQETFGLGGRSKLTDANLLDYRLLRINQYVYRRLTNDWYAGTGYVLTYNHRISEQGQTDGSSSDFVRYEGKENTLSSGIGAALLYDTRRNQNNPVAGGRYLSLQFLNNFRWLGSDQDWRSLLVDSRRYIGLGKRNILALWTLGWFAFNTNPPYLDLPATAWDANYNTGRGYTQGRFRGKNLLYGEAEYRVTLTKNGLLGFVIFANAQSVTDWPSNRFSRLHPGTGGGLRLKFNKKSNTNVAIDYGFGADGSRGFFVNLGEVF